MTLKIGGSSINQARNECDYSGFVEYKCPNIQQKRCNSLEKLTSVKTFDLYYYFKIEIIDNNRNTIKLRNSYQIDQVDFNNCKDLKIIKEYCKKLNIKILNLGSEYHNGILISNLID